MIDPQTIFVHHEAPELFADALRKRLPDWDFVCWPTDGDFIRGLGRAQILVTHRPPRGHWNTAARLRLLQVSSAGVDALLPAPDLPLEVQIANARGVHGAQMSEFALAMILALAKRLPTWIEQQKARRWEYHGVTSLAGKTLGILGLGSIGSSLARMSGPLGLRIIGTRRTPDPVAFVERVVGSDRTVEVLRESDFVVVLLPLTDSTRGFLGSAMLAEMKPTASLINLARGGIVDEWALAEALREGRLRGAALDVFEHEPLPEASPLWSAPNTILTPHVSGWFPSYADAFAEILVENLGRLERGEPLLNEVDRERGY